MVEPPGGDQPARVGQGEDARDVGGGQFTDGVAQEVVGPYAPGLDQAVQRDLDGEQGGLRVLGAVEEGGVVTEDDLAQRLFQPAFEVAAHGVEGVRVDGEGVVELAAHARPLGALAGEQERGGSLGQGVAGDGVRGGFARGDGGEAAQESGACGAADHGPVFEAGPGRHQCVGDVGGVECGVLLDVGQQACGLFAQGGGAAGRHDPRGHRLGGGLRAGGCGGGGRRVRGLLDHDVGVGAGHAEGGDTGAARAAGVGPLPLFGQQPDVTRAPVDA
nr:hypothetical protein HEP85_00840 [Streptomyces sp. RPA4-2]